MGCGCSYLNVVYAHPRGSSTKNDTNIVDV